MDLAQKEALIKRIDETLDSIRPHLKTDGGDIEVVEITDDMIVKIKWLGTCESCSMSGMTMKGGIEYTIKSQIPEIKGVMPVNGFFVEKK